MPVNGTIGTDKFDLPVAQTWDYIGIGLLTSMLFVGGPLNILSLFRALRINIPVCYRRQTGNSRRRRPRRPAFTLNFHLTLANLMVIWVYVLSEVCWRITYRWLGGDALCRIIRFVHAFCFYATSNLVSTIALNRLYIAVRIDRPSGGTGRTNAVRWFAKCAWTLAFLCSLPQLYVWRTFEPFPGIPWEQCVSVWVAERYSRLIKPENKTSTSNTVTVNDDGSKRNENVYVDEKKVDEIIQEANFQEEIYNAIHLAFVFWLPVLLIAVCYALIVTRFNRDIRKRSLMETNNSPGERETVSMSNHASTPTRIRTAIQTSRLRSTDVKTSPKHNHVEITGDATERITIANENDTVLDNQMDNDDNIVQSCFNCRPWKRIMERTPKLANQNSLEQSIKNGSAPSQRLGRNAGPGQPLLHHASFATTRLTRAKKRTVKKSVWILLAYLICWSPYNVLSLWRYIDPTFDYSFVEILNDLIVLNSVVNPLIYGI